jgi:hypothetical protein
MENTDEQKRWKDEKPGLYMTRTRLLSFGIFPKILYISDVAPFFFVFVFRWLLDTRYTLLFTIYSTLVHGFSVERKREMCISCGVLVELELGIE